MDDLTDLFESLSNNQLRELLSLSRPHEGNSAKNRSQLLADLGRVGDRSKLRTFAERIETLAVFKHLVLCPLSPDLSFKRLLQSAGGCWTEPMGKHSKNPRES